eukprot:3894329-Amphidinium_carterae.1
MSRLSCVPQFNVKTWVSSQQPLQCWQISGDLQIRTLLFSCGTVWGTTVVLGILSSLLQQSWSVLRLSMSLCSTTCFMKEHAFHSSSCASALSCVSVVSLSTTQMTTMKYETRAKEDSSQ